MSNIVEDTIEDAKGLRINADWIAEHHPKQSARENAKKVAQATRDYINALQKINGEEQEGVS